MADAVAASVMAVGIPTTTMGIGSSRANLSRQQGLRLSNTGSLSLFVSIVSKELLHKVGFAERRHDVVKNWYE
jgi:hypothetical protein